MTDEQKWDRLERIARLLAQPDLRYERELREQTKKLKAMVERHRIEDEQAAHLRNKQKPPDQVDGGNS